MQTKGGPALPRAGRRWMSPTKTVTLEKSWVSCVQARHCSPPGMATGRIQSGSARAGLDLGQALGNHFSDSALGFSGTYCWRGC